MCNNNLTRDTDTFNQPQAHTTAAPTKLLAETTPDCCLLQKNPIPAEIRISSSKVLGLPWVSSSKILQLL